MQELSISLQKGQKKDQSAELVGQNDLFSFIQNKNSYCEEHHQEASHHEAHNISHSLTQFWQATAQKDHEDQKLMIMYIP